MRVIDLTGPLERGTWRYDESFPAFKAEKVTSLSGDGFAVQRVTISTHMGTHTDAPGHLIANGPMIDAFALESFVGWATVLRVGPCGPLEAIDAARLSTSGAEPRPGDAVLIDTGWGARWMSDDYSQEHPFLTIDAARWLLDHRARIIGMDTAGLMDSRIELGPGSADNSPVVDRLLLEAGVPYIAALCNLESIRADHPLFVAMPLKLAGLDGAPVRAVAIEELAPSD